MEHRVGVEPTSTGFADLRVNHFATGALLQHDEKRMEHRVGVEPTNTGFADLRVDHFATGALLRTTTCTETQMQKTHLAISGWAAGTRE